MASSAKKQLSAISQKQKPNSKFCMVHSLEIYVATLYVDAKFQASSFKYQEKKQIKKMQQENLKILNRDCEP